MVTYKTIARLPGYRIGDDGSVWSCKTNGLNRCRSPIVDGWHKVAVRTLKDGRRKRSGALYVQICTADSGRGKICYIHRLVLEAFIGPCPPGMEGCHNDGNPRNNCLSNLRWDTKKGNAADTIRHGTVMRGERNHRHKLTVELVREIRTLVTQMSQHAVARRLKLNVQLVNSVVIRRTWGWLDPVQNNKESPT